MHSARLFLLLAFLSLGGFALAAEEPLTDCAAIRALPRNVAAQSRPVHLKAVITFAYPRKGGALVVQNGETGIYVDCRYSDTPGWIAPGDAWPDVLERGMLIELVGVTGPGDFAPVIYPKKIRILGTAPVPPAKRASMAELLDGHWDCQLARLKGVVQAADVRPREAERVRLELVGNGGRVTVNVREPIENVSRIVDAEAEVEGVVFTYFNNRGELVGARLVSTNASDVHILELGPEDPFAAPELQLRMLRPFSPEGVSFHRAKCFGTVTFARPGQYFFIQEDGRGVRVETRDPVNLVPGERVEVSGFVEVAEHFGKLREAVVRKIGPGERPEPIPVDRKRVLGSKQPGSITDAEDTNGLYSSLRGRLENVDLYDTDGPTFLVESEGRLVTAILSRDTPLKQLEKFEPGSEIRIDGILVVELASGWPAQDYPQPVDFRLLVHSPQDMTILLKAPWWTPQRLWILIGGICVILIGVLAWNWLLRRKVERRSRQLADEMRARREAEVEFDATLRERERLAADLHDTLEQSLTGVAFRLETMVVKREKAQDYSEELDNVRQLFASTREDVRRSIWNLRARALEGRTLPDAIHATISRLSGGMGVDVSVKTEGIPRVLPDFISGNLLLLAVEGVTNALKHAAAKSITVHVRFRSQNVRLTVEDDGRGFDLVSVAGPQEGHFGIQGMRERAKRLGGTLEVDSAPGKGARFTMDVPA